MSSNNINLISSYSDKFEWEEYGVFSSVLIISVGIGIFYGCFGSKQKSTEEYLMGDRKMNAFPVALSLLCSFVSAITLLGHPAEIYQYGAQHSLLSLSFIPMTFILVYFYVPVYFKLQVGSAYEYLEYRFNRKVRILISILGISYWMIYMAVVVYGPALAINQVTGMSIRVSTAAIFLVCIFYSSLGGLKAVVWTDAFQAILILVSMGVVCIKGVHDVGGFDVIWERISKSGRAQFFNFDFDPRTRHTVWTAVFGGYFWYMALFAATQAQVQRYLSMPNMATVRRALLYNMIGIMVTIALCSLAGFILYAMYHDCDPVKSGAVQKSDQMLPLFVMQTMGDLPGLPGLFVAGITCGSLSTISSGLNAVSAIITYDYIIPNFPKATDERISNLSKIVCIIFGLISYGLVFVAEHMGNLVPVWNLLIGMILGPSLGVFTLGMFFPWANTKGSLVGVITNFFLIGFIVIGAILPSIKVHLPDQKLSVSTSGCLQNETDDTTTFNIFNNITTYNGSSPPPIFWKDKQYDPLINIFSISYVWYSTLACISTVFFGLIFSIIFSTSSSFKSPVRNSKVKSKYLSPPALWFWTLICSKRFLSKWVEF